MNLTKKAWNRILPATRYRQTPTHQIRTAHALCVGVLLLKLVSCKILAILVTNSKAERF